MKQRTILSTLLFCALLLAGCGTAAQTPDATPTPAQETAATPTPDPLSTLPYTDGQLYAAAYLGYQAPTDLDFFQQTYFGGRELPVHHISDGDFYLIIPRDPNATVRLYKNDMVTDFLMNDKCSAGTGRFLEVMANTLSLTPQDLCELASKGSGTSISSMCTVFAESEVISLIGRGESRENIAFAVIDSIVQKVVSQAARLTNGQEECICLTGGLCDYSYLKKSLGESLKTDVLTDTDGRYAGAIGAAIAATTI